MSTPIFAVKPDDSLWMVQQIMEQRLIRRLAVTGNQGELLGIVKKIAELCGGQFSISSIYQQETTVHITLPIKPYITTLAKVI
ncbi:hypothetical protein ANSO36C_01590 [Nostoc cf. commune SO-36]|uniref:CBS domain-containing protein n=2 Tax=Nostoc commune TaxID=1178 RepID=A0ABM7YUQ9_NOSCO|nr:hypothetical protein ANSO36C_01590 [Nostoc cf. commune SO-36]